MIDFHTHLAPSLTPEALDADEGVEWRDGKLTVEGHSVGPAELYDARALLAYMDSAGFSTAVVSAPPPFYRQGTAGGRWPRTLNEGLLRAVDASSRLRPLAYLPLEDPEAAQREAVRVGPDNRWAGFVASAGGGSLSLSSAALDALWAVLDETSALVFLHPGHSPDNRLSDFYLSNLLGNPVETGVAVGELVFGSVLSRFPRIRFVLAHGGGVVPSMAGRWERGLESRRPGVDPQMLAPKEALRRLWSDSLTHDAAALSLAEGVFGADKIVWGSDWPFPMGCFDPSSVFTTDEAAQRIGSTNPQNLLG